LLNSLFIWGVAVLGYNRQTAAKVHSL